MMSTKPYLIRAFYEWIVDNNCTPHVVVDAIVEHVAVPEQYIEDGQIVLNIAMAAVQDLLLDNEAISFKARFNGIMHQVYVPTNAVVAIYAKENGRGMVFAEEENNDEQPPPKKIKKNNPDKSRNNKNSKKSPGNRSHLTVVK